MSFKEIWKHIIYYLGKTTIYIFSILSFFLIISVYLKIKNIEISITEQSCIFYDRYGTVICGNNNRIPITYEEIPKNLIDTLVYVEDRSYWYNYGISITGTIRAVIQFLPSLFSGKRPAGGSTITQQTVRLILFGHDFSFLRKIKDMIGSLFLSSYYSKKEILTLFFNNSYYGKNIFGIGTAARLFFNKSLDKLDHAEIACLVSVIKHPDKYNPTEKNEDAQNRIFYVLKTMYDFHLIDNEEKEVAIKKYCNMNTKLCFGSINIELKKRINNLFKKSNISMKEGNIICQTTIDMNLQTEAEMIAQSIAKGMEQTHKWKGPVGKITHKKSDRKILMKLKEKCGSFYDPVIIVNKHSYKTFNGEIKSFNEKSINKYKEYEKENGPINNNAIDHIVIINKDENLSNLPKINVHITVMNKDCELLASVGTSDVRLSHFLTNYEGKRPIGSTAKVLDLLCIFENTDNINLTSEIKDEPGISNGEKFKFIPFNEWIKERENKRHDNWAIGNWDNKFYGKMSLRTAFEQSRNIAFVDLILNTVGLNNLKKIYKKLHLTINNESILVDDSYNGKILGSLDISSNKDDLKEFYDSAILGCKEMNPMIFTQALCSLLNNGNLKSYNIFNEIKILGKNERKYIPIQSKKKKKLFKSKSMFLLLEAMKGVVKNGSAKRVSGIYENIYCKTGTSSDNKDSYLILLSSDHVCFIGIHNIDWTSMGENLISSIFPVYAGKELLFHMIIDDIPIMKKPNGLKEVFFVHNWKNQSYKEKEYVSM